MGIRLRKSIKVAPGIKLNLNKKSVSLTAGTKSAHVTMNSKGAMRASARIPGTGLPHVDLTKSSGKERLKSRYSDKTLKSFSVIFYILGVLLAIMALLLIIEVPIAGFIFLLFAVFLIFKGRQYSKVASVDREEAGSDETE